MMERFLVFLFLVCKASDSFAIDICEPFFFKWCHHHAGMFTVGILKKDYDLNGNFQLKISNHDMVIIKSNLSLVADRQNGFFSISLNSNGTKLLEKKRKLPICNHVYVKMKLINTKMHCGSPPPSIQILMVGNRKCQVPSRPTQSTEAIEHQNSCRQICSVCPKADLVGEIGFKINLDVTVLWFYNLKIAFKEDVEELDIVARTEQFKYAKWKKIDTGCNKLHHFQLTFNKLLNRYAVIEMFFRTKKRGKVPTITYIYYGNKHCDTYCGSNPCVGGEMDKIASQDTKTVGDQENFRQDLEEMELNLKDVISDDSSTNIK